MVKERDDELFDLKMALDIISNKKNKEQTQKKEDKKTIFDKTRASLNPKRPLVLSRVTCVIYTLGKETQQQQEEQIGYKEHPTDE